MAVVQACLPNGWVTRGMRVPKRVSDIEAWFKEAAKALKSDRQFSSVVEYQADMYKIVFHFASGNYWLIDRKANSMGMR